MEENKLGCELFREFSTVKSSRTNWEQYWEELAKYVQPMKNDVYGSGTKGDKRGHELFDAEAIHANETLASYLHTMLTNPSTSFVGFEVQNPELIDNDNVRTYLDRVASMAHSWLNDSNFQTEIHEVYLDLGSFGTSVMFIEEDPETGVRFSTRNIWECFPQENAKGVVDTMYRSFKWPLTKIADAWPDKLGRELLERLKVAPHEEYEIIHVVKPRNKGELPYESSGLPTQFPFSSHYVLVHDKSILEESGYREFPFIAPRWTKLAGEVYGRSPAMKALPDIKTLNRMTEITLKAAQLNIAPPMNVPDEGYSTQIKLKPLGINYYRAGTKDRAEPMLTGVRVDIGLEMISAVQAKVRKAFFMDQMELRQGPQMTATEVMRHNEDNLRSMAPILGRQHNETLKPLMTRLLGIIKRSGKLGPAPSELKDQDVSIVYNSQIAKVQKINESNNFLRALQANGQLIAANPELMDNLDGDEAVRYIFRAYGTPEKIISDKSKVTAVRDARSKAQQEQVEMQKALQGAEAANKVSPLIAQMEKEE